MLAAVFLSMLPESLRLGPHSPALMLAGYFLVHFFEHTIAPHFHFGEEVHDGNFVIDGLVFPDRTPSPGLGEFKKVVEPVRIAVDPQARTIGVRNLHHTRDTGYLRWRWVLEEEGVALGHGELTVPVVRAGAAGSAGWPEELTRLLGDAAGGEVWLTVSAVLGQAESWAPAGHEIAWAQERVDERAGSMAHRPGYNRTNGTSTRSGTAPGAVAVSSLVSMMICPVCIEMGSGITTASLASLSALAEVPLTTF